MIKNLNNQLSYDPHSEYSDDMALHDAVIMSLDIDREKFWRYEKEAEEGSELPNLLKESPSEANLSLIEAGAKQSLKWLDEFGEYNVKASFKNSKIQLEIELDGRKINIET